MTENELLVEFVGVPGSGKSTLANELSNRLSNSTTMVTNETYSLTHDSSALNRNSMRSIFALKNVLTNPIQAKQLVDSILSSRQNGVKESLRLSVYGNYIMEHAQELDSRPGIHIIDQGPIQLLWALKFQSDCKIHGELTNDFLNYKTAHLIVFVDCERGDIRERLIDRSTNKSRLESTLTEDQIEESIKKYNNLKNTVLKAQQSHNTTSIRCVNSSLRDIDQSTDLLHKFANEYI